MRTAMVLPLPSPCCSPLMLLSLQIIFPFPDRYSTVATPRLQRVVTLMLLSSSKPGFFLRSGLLYSPNGYVQLLHRNFRKPIPLLPLQPCRSPQASSGSMSGRVNPDSAAASQGVVGAAALLPLSIFLLLPQCSLRMRVKPRGFRDPSILPRFFRCPGYPG